jgi:hypothetical protein
VLSYIRSRLHLGGAFPLPGGDLTFERESRRGGVHVAPTRIPSLATAFFPTGPEAAENVMSKGPTTMKEE